MCSQIKKKKIRIDLLLVQRGIFDSRSKAQAYLMAGQILVNDGKIFKAGQLVEPDVDIRVIGEKIKFVSRGGLKLEKAINDFKIKVEGKLGLDVGASTGGFTDCLLQNGAKKVWAIDVGTNQLAWKLRSNPRVVSIEKCNFRYAGLDLIGKKVDIVVVDVSFISVTLLIKTIGLFLKTGGELVILIKPQFEVGKDEVEKGGIVKDPIKHDRVIGEIKNCLVKAGFKVIGVIPSPILGQNGNREFLCYALRV